MEFQFSILKVIISNIRRDSNWIIYSSSNAKLGNGKLHWLEVNEYLGQMQVVMSYLFERGIEWLLFVKFKLTSKKVKPNHLTFKINICQRQICIIYVINSELRKKMWALL